MEDKGLKRTAVKGIVIKKELRDYLKELYPHRHTDDGSPYNLYSLAEAADCSRGTIINFFEGKPVNSQIVRRLFNALRETFSLECIEGNTGHHTNCNSVNIGEKRTDDEAIENGIIRNGQGYSDKDNVYYWLERFTNTKNPVRFLIINGDSGRGKTFFAKQLRYWLCQRQPNSCHAWLDCTSVPPSPHSFWRLFRQLVSGNEQAELDRVFPKSTKNVHTESEFADGTDVSIYLKRTLLSSDAPPLYLYLDDFDRYKYELGDTKHALASFIETFGRGNSCLRIIATSRDKDLDQDLKKSLTGVEDLVDETGDALSLFQPEDTLKYLKYRGGALQNLEAEEVEEFIQWVNGDPLLLSILETAIETDKLPKVKGAS
jgi:hypothetical protein